MTPNAKKIIKISGLAVFFILIIIYAFFISKDLIFGVKITNVNIADGTTLTESVLKITGNAKNAVNLTLNGREITIDELGNWDETIVLLPGYNIVSVKAKDKFGNVDEKNYQIINNE